MRKTILQRVFPLSLALPLSVAAAAHADPYRLNIDAIGYTQSPPLSPSPTGLIVVQGDGRANAWVDAEASAWGGSASGNYDVLSAIVRVHDPKNYAELRLGRQMLTLGALRPIHVDGADVRLRAPWGTTAESFGGVPVVPQFAYRPYDWVAGGRVAQRVGRNTSLGVSYLQQRDDGRPSLEQAGADFASAPAKWFDIAAHGTYDLVDPGLAEAAVSLAGRFGNVRPEIYATHRSPSHLMPATSLFAALGDTPANIFGATLKWRMFPRLDLLTTAAAREASSEVGLDGTLRATLKLDDRGDGALAIEGRRQGAGTDRWTGIRLTARIPIVSRLRAGAEFELVAPDDPRGRGNLWPWGLVSLRWTVVRSLDVSAAVEAASTPRATREVNGLARLSWTWGSR